MFKRVFLTFVVCSSAVDAWEVPYPYSQYRTDVELVFGVNNGAALSEEAFRIASYGHYALSCYAGHRILFRIENETLQKSIEVREQMELLKRVAPETFNSSYEEELAEVSARIPELQATVAERRSILRSVVPHLKLSVDTLKRDHTVEASKMVIEQDYQAIVDRFIGLDEFGEACRSPLPDHAASSSAAFPFALGWQEPVTQESDNSPNQSAVSDAQREAELMRQIKAATPGCSTYLPQGCPSDEEVRPIARRIMAREKAEN
ncbi:MAG: hypothetical protein ABJF05_22220 [Paracoccaceae bacterium]